MFCKIWTWIGELKLLYSDCRKLVSKKPRVVMRDKERAYVIGQRAASGKNIYLTFGSEKTCPKSAEESYNRYSMAMKHYNQKICDKESFILGFEEVAKLNL